MILIVLHIALFYYTVAFRRVEIPSLSMTGNSNHAGKAQPNYCKLATWLKQRASEVGLRRYLYHPIVARAESLYGSSI